jgi:hypothetical protein
LLLLLLLWQPQFNVEAAGWLSSLECRDRRHADTLCATAE